LKEIDDIAANSKSKTRAYNTLDRKYGRVMETCDMHQLKNADHHDKRRKK
jgi:hypothetical protein